MKQEKSYKKETSRIRGINHRMRRSQQHSKQIPSKTNKMLQTSNSCYKAANKVSSQPLNLTQILVRSRSSISSSVQIFSQCWINGSDVSIFASSDAKSPTTKACNDEWRTKVGHLMVRERETFFNGLLHWAMSKDKMVLLDIQLKWHTLRSRLKFRDPSRWRGSASECARPSDLPWEPSRRVLNLDVGSQLPGFRHVTESNGILEWDCLENPLVGLSSILSGFDHYYSESCLLGSRLLWLHWSWTQSLACVTIQVLDKSVDQRWKYEFLRLLKRDDWWFAMGK